MFAKRSGCWTTLLVIAGLALAPTVQAQAAPSCSNDRACLRKLLDVYLDAVFKHDPTAAPLSSDHRATENAVTVQPGEGIWKTATGRTGVQRQYFDTVTGQAAYFGHVQEADALAIVSVRIKVVDQKIAEAEWTIARKGYFGLFDVEGLNKYPPPEAVVLSKKQRTSRYAMIALANGYFQALQEHDGSLLPHVAHCERVENGVKVTHRPRSQGPLGGGPPPAPAPVTGGAPTLAQEEISGDCVAGFEGFKNSIAEATLRRFPLIDEEQGVVMGMTIFRRPATSKMPRNLLTEFFYTRAGQISGIWAAMYYLDPAAPHSSGWTL